MTEYSDGPQVRSTLPARPCTARLIAWLRALGRRCDRCGLRGAVQYGPEQLCATCRRDIEIEPDSGGGR